MVAFVAGVTVIVQAASAVFALRLPGPARARGRLALVGVALLLLTLERALGFIGLLSGGPMSPTRLWLGLAISVASLAGVLAARALLEHASGVDAALDRSEARYRTLFERAPIGIGLADASTGRLIAYNDAMLQPGGYTREDIASVGSVAELYANPEDRDRVLGQLRRSGRVVGEEVRFRARDGSAYEVSLSLVPVTLDDQDLVLAFHEDMTDRVRVREALRASEAQFRAIFEGAGIGMALVDLQGRILRCNVALATFLGYTRDELVGLTVDHVSDPADQVQDVALKQEMLASGHSVASMDKRYRRRDGSIVWGRLTMSFVHGGDDQPRFVVGMVEDIDERKQAEEALRRSLELRQLIFANIDEIVFATGSGPVFDGAPVLFVSPKVESLLGHRPEDFVGDPGLWRRLVHPDDLDALMTSTRTICDSGRPGTREYRLRRSDGGYTWFEDRITPRLDDAGNLVGLFGVARDISDSRSAAEALHRSHEQLRDLAARLQAVREDERAMIAREMHDELGQALTAAKLDLSWLVARVPGNAEERERGRSLLALIDSTIATTRDLATRLRPAILDDLGLAAAAEWQVEEFERRTGIPVEFRSSLDGVGIERRRTTALFRILQECLTNVARHAGASRVTVELGTIGESVALEVSDDGKGLDPGAGRQSLGILGMRERAAELGGEIAFETPDGGGTRVRVRVPVAEPSGR